MTTYKYFVYTADALAFQGGTLQLDQGFDADKDRRVIEISDNDSTLDGDYSRDERGYDSNQRGTLYESDGSTLARTGSGTVDNERVYAEEQLILTGSDGSQIKVYVLESDGVFLGYLPTVPLQKGVSYSYSVANVISDDELSGSDKNRFPQYVGQDETDPAEYSSLKGAVVVCFTPNSQVTTPEGPRRIRDLVAGDLVLTRDNGFRPLRWKYHRTLSRPALQAAPHLAPIVFERDALGPGYPNRRMKVSPQHRILLASELSELLFASEAILAPAKGLVNGRTVYQDRSGAPVSYVHLLFDRHEVIEVDGLYSESYHPGTWILSGAEAELRAELFEIFPHLAEDISSYGPTCYPAISAQEARLLRG